MFVALNIRTHGDLALSQLLKGNDVAWHGHVLKAMMKACNRCVPFETVNVVARVTFLSSVGMVSFCRGNRRVSYDIFATLHEYACGKLSWLQVVRNCRKVQRELALSREFTDEALDYFKGHAAFLIRFLDLLPGDLGAPAYLDAPPVHRGFSCRGPE